MIKCAKCKQYHPDVNAVRTCQGVAPAPVAVVGSESTTAAPVGKPATAKQREFIERLRAERGQPATAMGLEHLTSKQASTMIETLLAMPKAAPATHPDSKPGSVEEGMYLVGDTVYKVQRALAQGSGHPYAKRLVPGDGYGAKAHFVYAPGILHTLKPEHRMTLEQAKQWGALYGTCCKCGRTLTDENSIEAGIGPVCAKKGFAA